MESLRYGSSPEKSLSKVNFPARRVSNDIDQHQDEENYRSSRELPLLKRCRTLHPLETSSLSSSSSSSPIPSFDSSFPSLPTTQVSSTSTRDIVSSKPGNFYLLTKSPNSLVKFRKKSLEDDLEYGVFASQGLRPTMEDAYRVIPFTRKLSKSKDFSDQTSLCSALPTTAVSESPLSCGTTIVNSGIETHFTWKSPDRSTVSYTDSHATLQLSPISQAESKSNYAFFGVFDGHGGNEAAEFVSKKLHTNIVGNAKFDKDPEMAIQEGFMKTEKEFENVSLENNIHGGVGTTACVCLIVHQTLFVANLGDSAAILCRNQQPVILTNSHTVQHPAERERIQRLGGVIQNGRLGHPLWNPCVVHIGVTRAIGDFYFKSHEWTQGKLSGLIAEPEIVKVPLTTDDTFLLIASDGFWDVVSPAEAVYFTKNQCQNRLDVICQELIELALKRSTLDNTTVLLIRLKKFGDFKRKYSGMKAS